MKRTVFAVLLLTCVSHIYCQKNSVAKAWGQSVTSTADTIDLSGTDDVYALADTLAGVPGASVILLKPGMTYMSSREGTGGYKFDKSLVIQSADMASAVLPKIYCVNWYVILGGSTVDSIVFRNISFSGNFDASYVFNTNEGTAYSVGEMKFEGCRMGPLRGIARFRGPFPATLGKFTMDNCVADSLRDYGILCLDTEGGIVVEDIVLKNSTFSRCRNFLKARTQSGSVLIGNCTISEAPSASFNMFGWRGGDGNNNITNGLTIRNTLWGHGWDENNTGVYDVKGHDWGSSLAGTTITIDNVFSTSEFAFVPGFELAGFPTGNYAGTAFDLWVNPCYADFNYRDAGFAGTAGDPRWTVHTAKKVGYFTLNKGMDITATPVTDDPVIRMLRADRNFEADVRLVSLSDTAGIGIYDIVVIQESFNSSHDFLKPGGKLGLSQIGVPFIYNEVFAFQDGRAVGSGGGTPLFAEGLAISVDPAHQSDDLFKRITFTDNVFPVFREPSNETGGEGTKALHYNDGVTLGDTATLRGTLSEVTMPGRTIFVNDIPAGTAIGDQVTQARMIAFGMNFGAMCRNNGTNMTVEGLTLWHNALYMAAGLEVPSANTRPQAHAGNLLVVEELTQVTLDGSLSSDLEGFPLTYRWTAPEGITLSDAASSRPAFTAPQVYGKKDLFFTLTVNDGVAESPPDQTYVTVVNSVAPDHFVPVWTGNGTDQMNINIIKATIDGADLEAGDEIALFDGDLCVGAAEVVSVIDSQNVLTLEASRDDGTGNGYTQGHPIVYKFWDRSSGKEMEGVTCLYSHDNPDWSVTGTYEPSAISFAELSAVNASLAVDLKSGWNIFSGNNTPANPDMQALLGTLISEGSLVKVQDEKGNSLEDYGNLGGWTNNIGGMALTEGYKIKVDSQCQLVILGVPAALPYEIPLSAGWNIIGFPYEGEAEGKSVMQPLIDRGTLIKVQDERGKSIEDWSIFGGWVNHIGNFSPGEGYKVKVNADDTLSIVGSYPKSSGLPDEKAGATVYFRSVAEGNGVDHMNINLAGLPAGILQAGDEIGVFDGTLCVGAVALLPRHLENRIVSIPVTAPGGQGEPGFTEDNPFTLKVWKPASGTEVTVIPEIIRGTPTFRKHESTLATLEKYAVTGPGVKGMPGEKDLNIYPNPTNGKLCFSMGIPSPEGMQVKIMDVTGRQLMTRPVDMGIFELDLSGMTSGVYYVRIVGNTWSSTKKVVLR